MVVKSLGKMGSLGLTVTTPWKGGGRVEVVLTGVMLATVGVMQAAGSLLMLADVLLATSLVGVGAALAAEMLATASPH